MTRPAASTPALGAYVAKPVGIEKLAAVLAVRAANVAAVAAGTS